MSDQKQNLKVENTNYESNKAKLNEVAAIKLKLERIDLTVIKLNEAENELANELKNVCDENGKETNQPASALLLHKLGHIYQKHSPDLFSLIRSATLYNAALLRNPPNKQAVEDDLRNLCSHILFLAGATNQTAQLTQQAKIIKQAVSEMRETVKQKLMEIKLIPENASREELHSLERSQILFVQNLQNQITDNYMEIMQTLARFCEEVMGKAPCKFALAGMGSLARREITPFSDFENIILLDNAVRKTESYENTLNYFRWFSVIFQIVLINIQETIVPSVAIVSLHDWFFDDITPRGISFDGMMPHACKFPLGRQQPTDKKPWQTELIKPAEEMLKYLSTEENLKNGYHLSDILTKTCFVYKDKQIFEEFEKGINEIIEKESESVLENMKKQVVDDLESFAMRSSLSKLQPNEQFNIKRIVYRSTTLFISALGRICNIPASSCFDIITELHAKNVISDYAKHKLMYAVAVACEIRLRWYMKSNKQCDTIDSTQLLVDLVGKKSIISYFQIAYALQCDITKRLNLKPVHFYSVPSLVNLTLYYCFGDQHISINFTHAKEQANPSKRLQKLDTCLKLLENQTIQNLCENASVNTINEWSKPLNELGEHLSWQRCFDDAIECYQKSTQLIQQTNSKHNEETGLRDEMHINMQKKISKNYPGIGKSFIFLNKYADAETNLNKSMAVVKSLPPGENTDREHALTLLYIGNCLVCRGKNIEAKQNMKKALQILQRVSPNVDFDGGVAITLTDLGRCLMAMDKHDEAKSCLDRSLLIKERISSDVDSDGGVAVTLTDLGHCLMKMDKHDEAKSCLDRSLQIKERISTGVDSDGGVAVTLTHLSRCLMKMNKHDEAKSCLDRSLQIKNRILSDVDSDGGVDVTLFDLGRCLMAMDKYDEAKSCLDRSLQIEERISSDVDSDSGVAVTLNDLGRCLMAMDKHDEAKSCLDRSLQIEERISSDVDSDGGVAVTLTDLGRCLMAMDKHDEAKSCLDRSLQIKERISSDVDSDGGVAITLFNLGRCLMKMDKHDEAKSCLDRSLQIEERISSDVDSDGGVAITLFNLGRCLMAMNKHDEAKSCLDRSLQIEERISSDVDSDGGVAVTLTHLGRCLMEMDKHDEAKSCLDRSLQIKERISSDVDSDGGVAITLTDLGRCLMAMDKHDEAKSCLDRSLQIKERISSDVESDGGVAITLTDLGRCLMKMDKHDEAKSCLDRSLLIKKRISSDVDSDGGVAATLTDLGRCLMAMDKHDEAKSCLDRSLQIKERISSDVDSDGGVAITLFNLGRCLMKMDKHDEAQKLFGQIIAN